MYASLSDLVFFSRSSIVMSVITLSGLLHSGQHCAGRIRTSTKDADEPFLADMRLLAVCTTSMLLFLFLELFYSFISPSLNPSTGGIQLVGMVKIAKCFLILFHAVVHTSSCSICPSCSRLRI